MESVKTLDHPPRELVLVRMDSIRTTRDVCTGIAYHTAMIPTEITYGEEKPVHFYVHSDYVAVRVCGIWYLLLDCKRHLGATDDAYRNEVIASLQYMLSYKYTIHPEDMLQWSSVRKEIENPEIRNVTEEAFLTWTTGAIFL